MVMLLDWREPLVFQRLTEHVFRDEPGEVEVLYPDDVLNCSQTRENI